MSTLRTVPVLMDREISRQILEDIPRSSYYIGTKVGRYEKEVEGMFDFSAERVTHSVDESLSRLGLRCVDIIQVIWRVLRTSFTSTYIHANVSNNICPVILYFVLVPVW